MDDPSERGSQISCQAREFRSVDFRRCRFVFLLSLIMDTGQQALALLRWTFVIEAASQATVSTRAFRFQSCQIEVATQACSSVDPLSHETCYVIVLNQGPTDPGTPPLHSLP